MVVVQVVSSAAAAGAGCPGTGCPAVAVHGLVPHVDAEQPPRPRPTPESASSFSFPDPTWSRRLRCSRRRYYGKIRRGAINGTELGGEVRGKRARGVEQGARVVEWKTGTGGRRRTWKRSDVARQL